MKKYPTKFVEQIIKPKTVAASKTLVNYLQLKSQSKIFGEKEQKFIKNYSNALNRLNKTNMQYRKAIANLDFGKLKELKLKKQKIKTLLNKKFEQATGSKFGKDGQFEKYTNKNPLVKYSKKFGSITIEKRIRIKKINIISGPHGPDSNKFVDEMSDDEIAEILKLYNVENYFDSFVGRVDDGWLRRVQDAIGAEHMSVQDFISYIMKMML